MRIVIVNGAECSGKSNYIKARTNSWVDQDRYDWYKFLNEIETNLMLNLDKQEFYIECCIDNRIRMAQLLDAIAAVNDWAKPFSTVELNIELVFIGVNKENFKRNLLYRYDCDMSQLDDRVNFSYQKQKTISELMASIEYYKYPLKFVGLDNPYGAEYVNKD